MLFKSVLVAGALQAAMATALNVDVQTNNNTPQHPNRVETFLQKHPHGNRIQGQHDRVDVDASHNPQSGTTVHGSVQARHRHAAVRASLRARNDSSMGTAIIGNRCDYDIWVWSVDQNGSSESIKVPARSKWSEPFREPCEGCGISYKVSKTDQLEGGKQTQFEYAIAGGQLWYDISFVDCAKGDSADDCPGHDKGLAMDSPNDACGKIECKGGSYCPEQAYYVDTPVSKLGLAEPVFGCGTAGYGMELYMKTCSDNAPLKRSIAGRMAVEVA